MTLARVLDVIAEEGIGLAVYAALDEEHGGYDAELASVVY